ncbi:hypothetical protein PIB30_075991 [Stylosanthes scabra]|uniref:Uncharacterized protein n=1 Tax=Stylosanthes scabra TaxID=79078 RepID=A0ABU6RQK3_9FABA|nr:hypothetical protein [Stylosanthes scabra]
MSTVDPRLDGLSPKENKPPQDGGVNPYPTVLGIHNSRGPRSQQNSRKSRVTKKSSPFGAEVAKESARNEKIAKKSLGPNPEPMRMHQRGLCIRIAMTWASRPSWNRTICVRT